MKGNGQKGWTKWKRKKWKPESSRKKENGKYVNPITNEVSN